MHRIVAPGGRLVLTTHGLQSVAYYARDRRALARRSSSASARALYRTGFWFADEFGAEGDWGVKPPAVGHGVLHARVARWRAAAPRWVVEELAVGANAGNQDVYVLRRT